MKGLKTVFSIFVIAFFICSVSWSQKPLKTELSVVIDHIDYGPGIGVVYGTYTYFITFKLDEDGYIKSMHWNVGPCNLMNEEGDKVKFMDSGTDTYGIMWDFWNNTAAYNAGWPIYYSEEDGWLDDIMPIVMPLEGTFSNMNCKVVCKGVKYDLGGMLQLHVNANGVITAYVTKGWLAN